MSTLPFSNLPADAAHRFCAVLQTVQECSASEQSESPKRLLDVGGYPCLFARGIKEVFPEWETHTLDQPKEELPEYTSASGMDIPFEDNSFDFVTSIDVFEHIPSQFREKFLSELCRVSKRWVVFCAPFSHPAVEGVEKIYNTIYREVFLKDHPWLGEHVKNGLPSLQETIQQIPSSHGCSRLIPSFDLMSWATLQGLSLLCQYKGEWDSLYDEFDQDFSQCPTPASSNQLCYRHLVVIEREAPTSVPLPEAADSGAHVLALAELYAGMLKTLSSQGTQTSSSTEVINQRLKDSLSFMEKELQAVKSKNEPPSLLRRLFKGG